MSDNPYERRQAERRERYAERAAKADRRAAAELNRADAIAAHIPPGQPILVGHHSESRHRRDLAKIDGAHRRAADERQKAEHYRRKAAGVGGAGISSDDPEAVEKLQARLEQLEAHHATMKRINREYSRSGGWSGVEIDDALRRRCERTMALTTADRPFPSYALTNNRANIRRIRARIAQLKATRQAPQRPDIEHPGFIVHENPVENRICIAFDDKPPKGVRTLLRSSGWRWSGRLQAWVRHLNDAGRLSVQSLLPRLPAMLSPTYSQE